MPERIKLKLGDIANPAFLQAFHKLGEEDIAAKEKYAMGRSLKQINSARETFEQTRVKLYKKFGKPSREVVAAKVDRLKASPKADLLVQ